MLALPFGDNEGTINYDSFNLCRDYFKKIEPAGKFFEEYVKLKTQDSFFNEFITSTSKLDEIIEEDTEIYDWEKEYYEKKRNDPIASIGKEKDNYYQLLGIEDLFLKASIDDVRKAFKKSTLLYHPDKNKRNKNIESDKERNERESQEAKELKEDDKKDDTTDNDIEDKKDEKTDEKTDEETLKEHDKVKDEINKKWLRVKEAYETLLDPEKRKKYDSTFDFDDEIPEPKIPESKFYKEFGPCFLKNSIWSVRKPIPKLGDKNTPIEKLKKFYQFWFNFDSWRDFSVDGEHNLEDASCRYEKRQMAKENKKLKSTQAKEEKQRISNLVNYAYKNDPRIKTEENKILSEKLKLKQEREDQREKERLLEVEKNIKLKQEYDDKVRRQKEELEKLKVDLHSDLINLFKTLNVQLSDSDLFQIQLNINVDTLKLIISQVQLLQPNEKEQAKKLKSLANTYYSLKFQDDEKNSTMWKKEELLAMQKAMKKFPIGVKQRWEKIQEVIKTKPQNQIIELAHFLATQPNFKFEQDFVNY